MLFAAGRIPTLPTVYKKIEEAVDDPDSAFEDIAAIVTQDQALSTRLLRLANSPFYGYPSAVCSVPEALTVIGLQQFKNMALSTCVMGVFRGIPDQLVNMQQFWKKSIACGLCARIMALGRHETNSERFFLGGLLHKIGRLIMYSELPEKSVEILQDSQNRELHLHHIETEMLGFNHAEIGGGLIEYWALPTSLQDLVGYYLRPVMAQVSVKDASLIHIADFLTEALGMGYTGERFIPHFSEAAWGHCGLDENRVVDIIDELLKQYDEVCAIFLEET